jgi:hypothetical protein
MENKITAITQKVDFLERNNDQADYPDQITLTSPGGTVFFSSLMCRSKLVLHQNHSPKSCE